MNNKKRYAISLSLLLAILWLSFSGHYTLLLLSCGLLSVVFVVLLVLRMDIVDREGHPSHLNMKVLFVYWCWLLKEILISNIYVCRLILNPVLSISPRVFTLRNSQSSDLVRVIFANSITLTPGTVTIGIDGDAIKVHALTEQTASSLLHGTMGDRVTALERSSGR